MATQDEKKGDDGGAPETRLYRINHPDILGLRGPEMSRNMVTSFGFCNIRAGRDAVALAGGRCAVPASSLRFSRQELLNYFHRLTVAEYAMLRHSRPIGVDIRDKLLYVVRIERSFNHGTTKSVFLQENGVDGLFKYAPVRNDQKWLPQIKRFADQRKPSRTYYGATGS